MITGCYRAASGGRFRKSRASARRGGPRLWIRRVGATRVSRGNLMQSNAAAMAAPISERESVQHPQPVPAWIDMLDRAIVAVLNVALVAEVVLVFVNTMVRTLFNSSALMGVDEASPLFLITLAFMGGAVA